MKTDSIVRLIQDFADNSKVTGIPIVLIGSTKFKEEFLEAGKLFTIYGHVTMHTDVFTGADGYEITEYQAHECMLASHRRIDIAKLLGGVVFVLNADGYIGESTKEEIEYAIQQGVRVEYLKPI